MIGLHGAKNTLCQIIYLCYNCWMTEGAVISRIPPDRRIMTDYFAFSIDRSKLMDISNLGLAHMGDAVYELMVRAWACASGQERVQDLHRLVVSKVAAPAQAKAAQVILPVLTEEEHAVFRRGRNARVSGVPKGCTIEEYHHATAFEALFGWLYLCGRQQRVNELFDIIAKGWENGA